MKDVEYPLRVAFGALVEGNNEGYPRGNICSFSACVAFPGIKRERLMILFYLQRELMQYPIYIISVKQCISF